ncbi:hypothetical protein GEMRC1_003528 [Eukaryota sp. GEM-RC1]
MHLVNQFHFDQCPLFHCENDPKPAVSARTSRVGLLLCLHIGCDPPDKHFRDGEERATTIASYNPSHLPRSDTTHLLNTPPDIVVEDLAAFCSNLRRSSQPVAFTAGQAAVYNTRVILYYNGYGVPAPKASELYFLNKPHTSYIPVNIRNIVRHLGNPATYILDCSNSGTLFTYLASLPNSYVFCSCSEGQQLPRDPCLPADFFTSCLTAPVETALLWYISRSHISELDPSIIVKLKDFNGGESLSDRKSDLGELFSILTAVMDAIAWSVLPKSSFRDLLRTDNPSAFLFRHFLLAERIMSCTGITPLCSPRMPPSRHHFLWQCWDKTVDCFMRGLVIDSDGTITEARVPPFFKEQLKCFEDSLIVERCELLDGDVQSNCCHLPILLQAVIAQNHREHAVQLLAKYVDHGKHAVDGIINVGFLTYFRKLIDSHYSRPEFLHICSTICYHAKTRFFYHLTRSKSLVDLRLFFTTSAASEFSFSTRGESLFFLAHFIETIGTDVSRYCGEGHANVLVNQIMGLENNSSNGYSFYCEWLLICMAKLLELFHPNLAKVIITPELINKLWSLVVNSSFASVRVLSVSVLHEVFLFFNRTNTANDNLIDTAIGTTCHVVHDAAPIVRKFTYLFWLDVAEKSIKNDKVSDSAVIKILKQLISVVNDPDPSCFSSLVKDSASLVKILAGKKISKAVKSVLSEFLNLLDSAKSVVQNIQYSNHVLKEMSKQGIKRPNQRRTLTLVSALTSTIIY